MIVVLAFHQLPLCLPGRKYGLYVNAHRALRTVFAAHDGEPEALLPGTLLKADGFDAKLLLRGSRPASVQTHDSGPRKGAKF